MNRKYLVRVALAAVAAAPLLMNGCGGGGGGSSVAPPPPPPPPPTAQQKGIEGGGVIRRFGTGFSTVTVSDQVFATNAQTTVTIDDQPATVDQLAVGNVVRVVATTDDNGVTAVASAIVQINDLKGPIEAGSIDTAAGTFVVLGQTVRVVATTVFDDSIVPRSIAGLGDGDRVEVSGLFDADGVVTATRIEPDAGAQLEVTGVVSNHDAGVMTFSLGALVVDYSGATLEDFDGGQIADGLLVEAEGATLDANGALVATEVENKTPGFGGDDGDLGEIEGFVTRFVSATDFDVAGLPVTTTAQTTYEDGSAADLALNVRVEVEGDLDANGVLVASKVEFEDGPDQANIEIEAPVDSVDDSAGDGTGSVVMLGIAIAVELATSMEDQSDAELEPFNLGDINPGDYLEIEGYTEPPGSANVIAVQLERDDTDADVVLQAPVDSASDPDLVLLGVAVVAAPGAAFRAIDDTAMTRADFFAAVGSGTLVKAKGSWDGVTLTARELELED